MLKRLKKSWKNNLRNLQTKRFWIQFQGILSVRSLVSKLNVSGNPSINVLPMREDCYGLAKDPMNLTKDSMVSWMRTGHIGSFIYVIGFQSVHCLGRIRRCDHLGLVTFFWNNAFYWAKQHRAVLGSQGESFNRIKKHVYAVENSACLGVPRVVILFRW